MGPIPIFYLQNCQDSHDRLTTTLARSHMNKNSRVEKKWNRVRAKDEGVNVSEESCKILTAIDGDYVREAPRN